MSDEPKHLHIVIDHWQNPWGPFDSAQQAVKWAQAKWPMHAQGFGSGRESWDVVALRSPDE